MFSYDGLIAKLKENGLTKTSLSETLGISSRTIAKIGRGEKIADRILQKMADYLDTTIEELCLYKSDNPILARLMEEKRMGFKGGLYHELQVRMTYNSNHIEGSRLSEEETRMIFETKTIEGGKLVYIDDIIETVNHFRAIDYVIEVAEEPLSEEIIKELHRILKTGTRDSALSWFMVGEYKKRSNVIGGQQTVNPMEVPTKMKELLEAYHKKGKADFEDIVAFHHDFECIHPFQDGNGRVGRLVALKECLYCNILPFLVEDAKKMFYYRGLSMWEKEKGYLLDTCRDGQDAFRKLLEMFDIEVY